MSTERIPDKYDSKQNFQTIIWFHLLELKILSWGKLKRANWLSCKNECFFCYSIQYSWIFFFRPLKKKKERNGMLRLALNVLCSQGCRFARLNIFLSSSRTNFVSHSTALWAWCISKCVSPLAFRNRNETTLKQHTVMAEVIQPGNYHLLWHVRGRGYIELEKENELI